MNTYSLHKNKLKQKERCLLKKSNLQVWTVPVQENTLDFYVAKMETTSTGHQKEQWNPTIEKLIPIYFFEFC